MSGSITTLSSSGSVAATAASGTAIATLSHTTQVTQKGVYEITAYAAVGAGSGANDTNNISVTVGSTTIVLPIAAVAGFSGQPVKFEVSLDGNTDVVMKVGANAAVAPYSGTLTARFLGAMGQLRR